MGIKGCKQAIIVFGAILCFISIIPGCGSGSKPPSPVLKKVEIQPATITVQKNGTCEFTAVGKDQNDKAMTINPTWSVTGDIGTVSPTTGVTTMFTATVVGSGTIVAKVGNVTGTAEVTVTEVEAVLTTIEISPSSVTMVKEDTQEFSVTGKDQYGAEIDLPAAAVWTVEGNIGVLSTNQGQTVAFTATTVGDGTIKASVESLTGEAQIKVVEAGYQPVLGRIEVSPGHSEFLKGETKTFTATGYDQYDNELTINPTWSLSGFGIEGTFNPETGPSTTFTANSFGWGVITASVGYIFGEASITVSPGLAEITVDPDSAIILEGETMTFEALGYHEQGLPTSINPTWSVTGNIGTVSPSTGSTTTFTATGGGTGTIVATDGEISGSAEIQVVPKVLRVGLGQDYDYATIQEAINAAIDGVTIEVDQGTYTENLTIDKSITLKSTDPDTPSVVASTIINGGGSDGVLWVRVQSNYQQRTVNIEGFTITNGSMGVSVNNSNWTSELSVSLKNNIISYNNASSSGGGVYGVGSNVQLTLEGNTIENNSAESEGGGICLDGSYYDKIQVTMTNNIIRNNSANGSYGAGGGIYARYVEGTWTGNTIDENSAVAYAGGIYLYDSSPTIIDNDIINNNVTGEYGRAGGIYIENGVSGICNPSIQNNTISGNTATTTGGGLYIQSPGLTLTGNTISTNTAAFGGGIMAGADTTLVNNIISGNTASENGGGLGVASGVGVVNISGNEFTDNISPQGGGVYVAMNGGELTGSGNSFNSNEGYAIYLHWDGATWTDEGGNTFSDNEPRDVYPEE